MRIIKKQQSEVPREDAHGGANQRRLYVRDGELESSALEAFTHAYIPAHSTVARHHHEGLEEVMLVLVGEGFVRDDDGEYPYKAGDLFIFPRGVYHEVENRTDGEHEFVFVRVR